MTFENSLPSSALPLTEPVLSAASAPLARSEGRVEIRMKMRDNQSHLSHLYQRGCGRVRFPSIDRLDFPEAVLINTAGGLTGGDAMSYDVELEPTTRLTISGQAAEKIYRSVGTVTNISSEIRLSENSFLEWLPQETILFEKSRLKRLNNVHLRLGSRLLALEATVFGRKAHGENLTDVQIQDGWKIWRDGKLLWFDNFKVTDNFQAILRSPAHLDNARAMATFLIADEKAEEYVDMVRDVATLLDARVGTTSRNGLLITRILAKDGYSLRKSLTAILQHVRSKLAGEPVPLPKVWE
ncbi:MAG: urease accessory protein UreD [Sneathiella sp.]